MASSSGTVQSLFDVITANPRLKELVESYRVRQDSRRVRTEETVLQTLDETTYDPEQLSYLILTAFNGGEELPEQKVRVEYLKSEQKLVIPYALGMSVLPETRGEVEIEQTLFQRYWKVSKIPYTRLHEMVAGPVAYSAVREEVDAIDMPNLENAKVISDWLEQAYYVLPSGELDTLENAATTFAYVSHALQFNCDLRDTSFILLNSSRMSDALWKDADTIPKSRLNSQLCAYTLQRIAALNLTAWSGSAMAAWTIAYALSAGVLHNLESKMQREYRYWKGQPARENTMLIAAYERDATFEIFPMAMNIVAMFGLLHLHKDHTFKTNDSNMERVCTSYLQTLRTLASNEVIEQFRNQMEAICRTAAHPFGLAQTYCVALTMGKYGALASPLAIRVDVTPPPVQRIMIAHAAVDEWSNLPIGRALNSVYQAQVNLIKAERGLILANPAAYSGLHRLYAIPEGLVMSEPAKLSADALMPVIYGFAMAQHVDDQDKKDGLALALSLNNVAREKKSLVTTFTNMWEHYLEKMDKEGLIKLAQETLELDRTMRAG